MGTSTSGAVGGVHRAVDGRPVPADDPPPSRLGVRITRVQGAAVVTLSGDLDVYNVPELRRRLAPEDTEGLDLVVDVGEARLVDSAGLGALVSLRNAVVHSGRRFGVATGRQARVFAIAGLTDALECGPDAAAVLARLSSGGSP